jgi:hypothetical protein
MAHFTKVARLTDLSPGTGMMVVGPFDKPMALFNVAGEVFAINAICPHRGGSPRQRPARRPYPRLPLAWLDLRCPDRLARSSGRTLRGRLRGGGPAQRHLRGLIKA